MISTWSCAYKNIFKMLPSLFFGINVACNERRCAVHSTLQRLLTHIISCLTAKGNFPLWCFELRTKIFSTPIYNTIRPSSRSPYLLCFKIPSSTAEFSALSVLETEDFLCQTPNHFLIYPTCYQQLFSQVFLEIPIKHLQFPFCV